MSNFQVTAMLCENSGKTCISVLNTQDMCFWFCIIFHFLQYRYLDGDKLVISLEFQCKFKQFIYCSNLLKLMCFLSVKDSSCSLHNATMNASTLICSVDYYYFTVTRETNV